jgi:putative methyltransferase (TIGR04325 family)
MTKTFNIWEGVYSSFEDAEKDSKGNGFGGNIYNTRALDAANACLDSLKAGLPIPSFHKQRSNILPPVVAMMLDKKESLNILDFGGGLGIGYMTLAESIPEYATKINYSVVELAEICEQGILLHKDWGKINFLDQLPDSNKYDLIHSASALQYVDDWKGLLKKITSYEPEYILLSDVFAGTISTFVTLQNYYDSKIKHWFFNLDELISFFSSIGYALTMKSYVNSRRLDSEDVLPMENFPAQFRIQHTLHLLLKKSK